jgi:hypothetical protein
MSTTQIHHEPAVVTGRRPLDLLRLSAGCGLAFVVAQLGVMVVMTVVVLPHGIGPDAPALERGESVREVTDLYRAGNYAFMIAGSLLLGFLGVVAARLRRADPTGSLATVAVAAGTLLALIWPLGGMLHDVALEVASGGTDPRILGGWDAVAPFSLAFSAFARVFFLGALVLGLRATDSSLWLRRTGVVVIVLSVAGSATLVTGAMFPLLALSTLGYELWVGALAWTWLRRGPETS